MVKKVIYIVSLALFVSFQNIKTNKAIAGDTTTYAKALVGCNLYKNDSLNLTLDNIYFIVPETYFVVVLDTINDNCFKVQYGKYIGYVESSTIVIATFVPVVKTLEKIKFDIKSTSGTQIWSMPTANSNVCTTIASGTKNINYIAYAYGDVPSGGESNIWFFVSFTPEANSTNVYEGYIYSENTTNLTEIVANHETNPEVIESEIESENTILISSTFKTIIVAIIAVPVILFLLIILYKFVKKHNKITNKDKNIKELQNQNTMATMSFDRFKSMKKINRNTNGNAPPFDENDDELL